MHVYEVYLKLLRRNVVRVFCKSMTCVPNRQIGNELKSIPGEKHIPNGHSSSWSEKRSPASIMLNQSDQRLSDRLGSVIQMLFSFNFVLLNVQKDIKKMCGSEFFILATI